ncbi:MAG: cobalamin-binding protein [Pseudomonadota bacterium]|nr:cobalamin-binding protein [Pseudomonadota bacterium]
MIDDRGQTIHLAQPAQRVIALSPHLTENLFAIGAGATVVGVVSYSDYPAAAQQRPIVGGYTGFDLEKIRTLRPDLIVAWHSGNPSAQLARVESLGIPIYYSESPQITDIPKTLQRLGKLTGHQQQADQAARTFNQHIAQLKQRYATRRNVTAFYQVWDRPLMTINQQQVISSALQICGATNVFAKLPQLVPTIDDEAVLAKNPEVILTSSAESNTADALKRWQRWPHLIAVQRENLIVLPPDLLSRMGPRFADGTQQLCEAIDHARRKVP